MCDKKDGMEGIRHCLFDMENWSYSDWSEEPALALCQTGLSTDSFLVPNVIPCQPPSESSSSFQLHGYDDGFPIQSWFEPFEEEEEEDRGASASKNHSQAEKRRRDRINAHLASLRKLVPNSDKMDKATLLRSVVEKVKELKKESVELSRAFTLPTDTDQVTVDSVSDNQVIKDDMFIKASICCDDRPELMSELKNGIKGLKLKTLQAHVSSLGGRIQGIFILCNEDGVGMDRDRDRDRDRIKQSVRVMLNRIVSLSSTTSNYRVKSKRQRFFFPSHHS